MIDFIKEARALFPYTQSMRRDFHIHPELGFHEVRTGGNRSERTGSARARSH